MVFVAGRQITDLNQFSNNFLTILKLISEGHNWLKWALTDPSLSVYYAKNEQDLLSKIQAGLHETMLLKCATLTMHIDKAMSVEDPDLEMLEDLYSDKTPGSSGENAFMKRYDLVSNSQLRSLSTFLEQYSLTDLPAFQGIGFSDQLALYRFQQNLADTSLTKEALDFAGQKAATSMEFVHYAGFYFNCNTHQLPKNTATNKRAGLIEEMYNQLSEPCFSLIYVPNIGPFDTDEELAGHLNDFILVSKFPGYRIKASAMENLARNIQVKGSGPQTLKNDIDHYMDQLKEEGSKGSFHPNILPQDGELKTFTSESGEYKLVVQVSPGGEVFLSPETQPIAKKAS